MHTARFFKDRPYMQVGGSTAIVTGAAGGIGRAISEHLLARGASVALVDRDGPRLRVTANALGTPERSFDFAGDLANEETLRELLDDTSRRFGSVDLFVANAGVGGLGDIHRTDDEWELAWNVNVMAHVRAVRLLIDGWLERRRGYFVATASAAGLLTQLGAAPNSVSKHAAVGLAEWLAVTYGDRGIGVSCVCPMGVDMDLYQNAHQSVGATGARAIAASGDIIAPDDVGRAVVEAIEDERFLVLPHPEVAEYMRRKLVDYDRWLRGMQRLRVKMT